MWQGNALMRSFAILPTVKYSKQADETNNCTMQLNNSMIFYTRPCGSYFTTLYRKPACTNWKCMCCKQSSESESEAMATGSKNLDGLSYMTVLQGAYSHFLKLKATS